MSGNPYINALNAQAISPTTNSAMRGLNLDEGMDVDNSDSRDQVDELELGADAAELQGKVSHIKSKLTNN